MLSSLNSAVSGLQNYQEQMDVIGNNIANVNTTGYKAATTNFADAFSNTLGTYGSSSGFANPIQVGTGVTTASITNNWNQGTLNSTGVASNLAIQGNGFFVVRDTVSGNQYATRAGDFTVDSSGYLISSGGDHVQGFSDAGLSTIGDIKIDSTGMPATSATGSVVTSFTIDNTGRVTANLSDGTSFVRGQVLMQNFENPQALVSVGNNLYSGMDAAGGLAKIAAAGSNGLGTVQSGKLESSNVDLSNEMAGLITAQRAFEANSKIVTTSDEVLQTLVNMKH